MESSWVIVATYDYPHQARLARTLLDAAEIPTSLADDHLTDAFPFYAVAVGGIKLRVPPEQFEEARALLGTIETEPLNVEGRTGWWSFVVLMGAWPVAVIGGLAWILRGGKRGT